MSKMWILLLLSSCSLMQGAAMIQVSSSTFKDGADLSSKVAKCGGENISPQLAWSSIPTGTKSLALIVSDPDAPRGTFYHWVVFNIPVTTTSIDEGATSITGATQGTNSFGNKGYDGPCPPSGTHRYMFTIYALSDTLPLTSSATAQDVLSAIKNTTLDQGQITGRYGK